MQTQWTRDEGGDDNWYGGKVQSITNAGKVNIQYDDGDTWCGDPQYVWLYDNSHPLKNRSMLPQAQPIPQAAQTMLVNIPQNSWPGQSLPVQSPSGVVFMVQVPPGVRPGAQIQVQVPAPAYPSAPPSPPSPPSAEDRDKCE